MKKIKTITIPLNTVYYSRGMGLRFVGQEMEYVIKDLTEELGPKK